MNREVNAVVHYFCPRSTDEMERFHYWRASKSTPDDFSSRTLEFVVAPGLSSLQGRQVPTQSARDEKTVWHKHQTVLSDAN